ncbi:methionine ABC transporter ATP-binding protein [Microbacterium sp. AK031]|uniref:methionine ABC transporter ATP-binding protein n=1 Tax=Microbacterium sp. AK031 TaxID=2723076 RepID=UPI0021697485|nr:methionine ABC transporter ATP-binding protein [Microbacterium sp. AK031]MCS3843616.1 D-methionine transport system ATP-binding protein [Microbacterium sp. AK031]
MTDIISFDRVSKAFPGTRRGPVVDALDDVDLEVQRGSIVGVIGYSGAGKSTLVRLINGLEKPTGGTVNVLGVDVGGASETELRGLRARIGMIFQQFNLFNSRTVRGNVAYPLKVAGWKRADIGPRVAELLDFVGIGDKAGRYPRALSGGQKQRVGIVRAIAANPELLLADEATSALDPQTTGEVLALLKEINRRLGITIVVITHQISGVPSGDTLEALLIGGGTLVSVDVNEFTSEDIDEVFEKHGVRRAVVFGGVTDIRGRQLGTLTYRLQAGADAVAEAVGELSARTKVTVLRGAAEVPASGSSSGSEGVA